MMNELFVLGELMEHPETGYGLQKSLEGTLGRHRKISFGVLYPLLNKLEKNGYIIIQKDTEKSNKKISTITDSGRERFLELMDMDVPEGSFREEIFQIKLDAMQHLEKDKQIKILDLYIDEQLETIKEAKEYLDHFKKKSPERRDHRYAEKKMSLRLQMAKDKLNWANNFKKELSK